MPPFALLTYSCIGQPGGLLAGNEKRFSGRRRESAKRGSFLQLVCDTFTRLVVLSATLFYSRIWMLRKARAFSNQLSAEKQPSAISYQQSAVSTKREAGKQASTTFYGLGLGKSVTS